MATVTKRMNCSPNDVFDVLRDGWRYTNWVVGTSHMRAVDAAWPAPGSKLHHCSGVWPIATRDETIVDRCEDNQRLELTAKGGWLGSAKIVIGIEPDGDGTVVTLTETPVAGPGEWLHNPLNDALLRRRNVEALERLAAMSERRTEPAD
jgi:hypothetical protein